MVLGKEALIEIILLKIFLREKSLCLLLITRLTTNGLIRIQVTFK